MLPVTLGRVIYGSQSNDCLGLDATTQRAQILSYIEQAIELAAYEANWQINLGTLDICADQNGILTLPWFVGTVLAVNVGGYPTYFRNSWYEYHINGLGSNSKCGGTCGWGYTDDMLWSPTLQDLQQWSCVAAVCEDPIDGSQQPLLQLIVQGETMDQFGNSKAAITIPPSGPSQPGVLVPLINNYAATDQKVTMFKKITQVTKPVTRGYVKLIGFPPQQNGNGVTIGYYAPNECNPRYRRIRLNQKCGWARVKYRRAELPLTDDYEIIPVASFTAMLDLLRVVRYREVNRGDDADKALARVIDLLTKIEVIQEGPGIAPVQVDPGYGIGSIDFR
jgi:hypothetical protein